MSEHEGHFAHASCGGDELLEGLFSTPAVSAVLGDRGRLQAMLDFEVALAAAEAETGLIPQEAADLISQTARSAEFDRTILAQAAGRAGNLAIPFVTAFTKQVAEKNRTASGYVHLGATSQDVIDTATILQLRESVSLILKDVRRLETRLAAIIADHSGTILPGRTWLQHAVPTTLGLKAAGWLTNIAASRKALSAALESASVLQFGGAAGTLASLQGHGLEVGALMAERLKLRLPALPWHSIRSDLVRCGTSLGLLCGALGKLARDASLMMQTEIGELLPPGGKGRGGSSTMPHKRNPVGCAIALSAALQAPGLVSTLLSAMVQEHERGLGGWHAEWQTLPSLVRLAAASASQMADMIETVEIHSDAMRRDCDLTHGVVMAEAVAMALAPSLGKQAAHEILEQASHDALSRNETLGNVITRDPRVTALLAPQEIAELLKPENYLGNAREFCARALECWQKGN